MLVVIDFLRMRGERRFIGRMMGTKSRGRECKRDGRKTTVRAEIASLFVVLSIVFCIACFVCSSVRDCVFSFMCCACVCFFSCNAGVYAFRCSAVLYQCDYCASEKKSLTRKREETTK